MGPHINYPNLPLFNYKEGLKSAVRASVTQAIKELITGVTERAIGVAMSVTDAIVKKDFAMDPDPQRLKLGAYQMARSMTAGKLLLCL